MLHSSVGEKGSNRRDDTLVVQRLLKSKGNTPGSVDGVCGPKTIAAIRTFQRQFLLHPDGLVQPAQKTWLKLSDPRYLPTNAALMQWSGDSSKWPEAKKLHSMHVQLRSKVQAVLRALGLRGFQPKIYYAWRSVAVQLEIYRKGNSSVQFSFHNAQLPDGTPNAYAVDIIDSRYGWSGQAETSGFWTALGEEAKKEGLYWGGDWYSFRDWAHVQLVPNSQLTQVRRESGL